MNWGRSIGLGLGLAAASCFSEPGSDGSDADGGETAGSTSADASGSATTTGPSSGTMDPGGVTSGGVDGSSDGPTETDSSADESTGGPPDMLCVCPPMAILCEDFDGGRAGPPPGWSYPLQDVDPFFANDPGAPCDGELLRTEVPTASPFSVAVLDLPPGDLSVAMLTRIEALLRFTPPCLAEDGFLRVMEFQAIEPMSESTQYVAGVWFGNTTAGQLRLKNTMGGTEAVDLTGPPVVPDTWIHLAIDLDFAAPPMTATVRVDGVDRGAGTGDFMTMEPVSNLGIRTAIGPYLGGPGFPDACQIDYEWVRVTPPPP